MVETDDPVREPFVASDERFVASESDWLTEMLSPDAVSERGSASDGPGCDPPVAVSIEDCGCEAGVARIPVGTVEMMIISETITTRECFLLSIR